jgi:hypothetical protein
MQMRSKVLKKTPNLMKISLTTMSRTSRTQTQQIKSEKSAQLCAIAALGRRRRNHAERAQILEQCLAIFWDYKVTAWCYDNAVKEA